VRCVVEQFLPLERELSVMVARRPGGELSTFPPALNHHEHGILAWSLLPAPADARIGAEVDRLARGIAEQLGVEGLLAVEFFVLADGAVLVNELAPRPHNSFHGTERACDTSQFEQAVRAVCDLPLGDAAAVRPTAIANVLGDLWEGGHPRFADALLTSSLRLHLYGKKDPRAGRKMGHLSACGATPDEALARVRRAWSALANRDRA
jgi:5-(carboxyamino)imidazole ribonucleotide synthase